MASRTGSYSLRCLPRPRLHLLRAHSTTNVSSKIRRAAHCITLSLAVGIGQSTRAVHKPAPLPNANPQHGARPQTHPRLAQPARQDSTHGLERNAVPVAQWARLGSRYTRLSGSIGRGSAHSSGGCGIGSSLSRSRSRRRSRSRSRSGRPRLDERSRRLSRSLSRSSRRSRSRGSRSS
jgi:hypothetical protein